MKSFLIALFISLPFFIVAQPIGVDEEISEARVWFDRGVQALFNKNNLDKQVECYSKAIELNPDYIDAYRYRAAALFKQDKFDACIADCDKYFELITKLDQKSKYVQASIHYRRAESWAMKGDYQKAKLDYYMAAEMMPRIEKYVTGKQKIDKLIGN